MSVLQVPSDQPIQISPNSLWLDMCGWKVTAGFPSPAADHTHKRIDLNDHLIRNKEATFLFRVKGDSMSGIGIYEGDTLVVDRSAEPKHNSIVLAILNNEFTVKRLYRRGQFKLRCPKRKTPELFRTGDSCHCMNQLETSSWNCDHKWI